jgi:hypothetical protein
MGCINDNFLKRDSNIVFLKNQNIFTRSHLKKIICLKCNKILAEKEVQKRIILY